MIRAALALALAALAGPAQAQQCADRVAFTAALTDRYDESVMGLGLSPDGLLIEVWVSAAGTWTVTGTTASGLTCLIAAGEAWQGVAPQVAGVPG